MLDGDDGERDGIGIRERCSKEERHQKSHKDWGAMTMEGSYLLPKVKIKGPPDRKLLTTAY